MKTIDVKLGDRSHVIHIESGLLKRLPELLSKYNQGQKWVIVSQKLLIEKYVSVFLGNPIFFYIRLFFLHFFTLRFRKKRLDI